MKSEKRGIKRDFKTFVPSVDRLDFFFFFFRRGVPSGAGGPSVWGLESAFMVTVRNASCTTVDPRNSSGDGGYGDDDGSSG